jgi:hypothetical protein
VGLKCADVGHLAAPWEVHHRWVSGLEEEFFRQGDKEKSMHMMVSPLMDRCKDGITKSQVSGARRWRMRCVRTRAPAGPGSGVPTMHSIWGVTRQGGGEEVQDVGRRGFGRHHVRTPCASIVLWMKCEVT